MDFEGAAYGATRYEMNFGNEAVNWSGLSSFTEVAASHPKRRTHRSQETPPLRSNCTRWTPETGSKILVQRAQTSDRGSNPVVPCKQ